MEVYCCPFFSHLPPNEIVKGREYRWGGREKRREEKRREEKRRERVFECGRKNKSRE